MLGSPANILGVGAMTAWYDISDSSTVTLDGAGGITAVADKSGNGRTLTVTGATHPQRVAAVGGRPMAKFVRGTSNLLASSAFTQAQPVTMFVAFKEDALSAGTFESIIGQDFAIGGPAFADFGSTFAIGDGVGGLTGPAEDLSPHVMAAIFQSTTSILRLDAVTVATGDPGSRGWTAGKVVLGGDVNPESDQWTGLIGEVLIYSSALPSGEIPEQYLINKWLRKTSTPQSGRQPRQFAPGFSRR